MMDVLRVINLDRAACRMRRFQAMHPEVPIRRVEAQDGATLDRHKLVHSGTFAQNNCFTAGALGCAMSHLQLWRMCLADGIPYHIAEDDVTLCEDFWTTAGHLLRGLDRWDIVLWGYNADWPLQFRGEYGNNPSLLITDIRTEVTPELRPRIAMPRLFGLIQAAGTTCYSISAKGAARLLERCLPIGGKRPSILDPLDGDRERTLPPHAMRARRLFVNKFAGLTQENNGIDVELCNHYRELDAYVCLPSLTLHRFDTSDSSIQ
ncbi:MAG TPA: glycosyltransferase family 25 protein [Acetobacteraceae bacterium]|nr:glycosyltransferase family 25 protein [Acetobacteraceae bacterium]